jgi:hypothetical protein
MKLIKTESNQAIHLYKMLGVTAAQFKQAQDWYLSAQQDRKTNKTKTTNKTDQPLKQRML